MINLALYSDQIIPANSAIDTRLLTILRARGPGTRIGYIPSGPDPAHHFFNDRKSYYSRVGLDLCLSYALEDNHKPEDTDALFACDAIHISGGQTADFLNRLQLADMVSRLRDWALSGGVLIGTSAGAILMTPTIALDALFTGGRPEDLQAGDALGLLPFEFFPHLNANPNYLSELVRYSKISSSSIVACNDGDGLVVCNGKIEFIGDPLWIAGGQIKKARNSQPCLSMPT